MNFNRIGLRAAWRGVALLVGVAWITVCAQAQQQAKGNPPSPNTSQGQQTTTPGTTQIPPNPPLSAGSTLVGNGAYALVPVSNLSQLNKPAEEDKKDGGAGWLSWFATVLASIAWPVTTLILAWLVLGHQSVRDLLGRISQGATQIKVAGLELELTPQAKATIEDLQTLIAQVPATHHEWVANTHIGDQFRRVVREIRSHLCDAAVHPFSSALPEADFRNFRFTLHVPDIVLTHSVRQLVNYSDGSGGRAGRIFSTRRGIIGLAWRLEKSRYRQAAYNQDELVEYWGMTRSEAEETSSAKNILLVFLVKSPAGEPLGMLYGDAGSSTLFDVARLTVSTDEAFEVLAAKIQNICDALGLTASLLELEKARKKVTQVDIYYPTST